MQLSWVPVLDRGPVLAFRHESPFHVEWSPLPACLPPWEQGDRVPRLLPLAAGLVLWSRP